MDLPVVPPIKPMLAKASKEIPEGQFAYEPKWDGFRAIIFRDGPELEIASRNAKSLTRYFPELVGPLLDQLPPKCVLDGELVVPGAEGLDFDLLGQRIHPAESRVERLAGETPAHLVVFDILALDDMDLRPLPFIDRRGTLDGLLSDVHPPLHLTPFTTDIALAAEWFSRFDGHGFDGVMAKATDGIYEEDRRSQIKVKHHRSVDCVVAGYAEHRNGGVGSLKLGLFEHGAVETGVDDSAVAPVLHHVGVASSFSTAQRRSLVAELEPLREGAEAAHPWLGGGDDTSPNPDHAAPRVPGAPNRWSNGRRSADWIPLRIERVVEVTCENVSNGRFRHPARFIRWRPDKTPIECSIDQLDTAIPPEFGGLFGS